MKSNLDWHRRYLANMRAHLATEQSELDRKLESVESLVKAIAFRERQIATAERMKKEGFDAERFLVTKTP